MSVCTPAMAVKTVPIGAPPWPPMAYSTANAIDEAITEMAAATNDATTTEEVRLRRIAIDPMNAAHPTSEVTMAMLSTLSPRALIPPSAKIKSLEHHHHRHRQQAHRRSEQHRRQGTPNK